MLGCVIIKTWRLESEVEVTMSNVLGLPKVHHLHKSSQFHLRIKPSSSSASHQHPSQALNASSVLKVTHKYQLRSKPSPGDGELKQLLTPIHQQPNKPSSPLTSLSQLSCHCFRKKKVPSIANVWQANNEKKIVVKSQQWTHKRNQPNFFPAPTSLII
jgi:hypothetical protein